MSGIDYYINIHCRTPVVRSGLWRGDPQDELHERLECDNDDDLAERPAGLVFSAESAVDGAVELQLRGR